MEWNGMECYSLQNPICNQQVAGSSPIASLTKSISYISPLKIQKSHVEAM